MRQDWISLATARLPRYTSYPTAADFSTMPDGYAVRSAMERITSETSLGVYVHVPFCEKLCWYCGCATTVPNGYRRVSSFVDVLMKEIDVWRNHLPAHADMRHLHFGGGSPNSLNCGDFREIINHIKLAFGVDKDVEIDIELDPRTTTDAFIETLASCGVTRASLGVQTLSGPVQKAINRIQPRHMVTAKLAHLRQNGIRRINMDLMYGLPLQTREDVKEAAKYAADVGADRISLFGYAHVPWFAKHQRAIHDEDLPGLEERFEQARVGHEVLTAEGYVAIGLDHYARPEDSLTQSLRDGTIRRTFQGYTDNPCKTLIGLGPSAISELPGGFFQTSKAQPIWRAQVEGGVLPISRGVLQSADDKVRARAIETVMSTMRVDINDVAREMHAPMRALEPALDAARKLEPLGLCTVSGTVVEVPEEARMMLRTVASCFDWRLASSEGRHAVAV
ncbi:MAG: oxygen-independent coproporphyrinogen III oxidase [Alphaproteobacteria bacterium]|mgnify:CR=1 FL=1|nr:oxygen-independent coproporphyrinogen III oxidase [Alphaproteobacteria bacterium]